MLPGFLGKQARIRPRWLISHMANYTLKQFGIQECRTSNQNIPNTPVPGPGWSWVVLGCWHQPEDPIASEWGRVAIARARGESGGEGSSAAAAVMALFDRECTFHCVYYS